MTKSARQVLPCLLLVSTLLLASDGSAQCASCPPHESGPHEGACLGGSGDGVRHCGRPAPPYPVPHPTPRPTTYTHLWYPPMMPHNSLPHYRSTYSYRHGPGLSRTTVMWRPSPWVAFDKLHNLIELPR